MTPLRYSFEFLAQLNDEQRQRFERAATVRVVDKGQQVIGQGAGSTDVFFVVEGEFRVLIFSPSGREVAFRVVGPGGFFGELAALDLGRRSATVAAQTKGRLVQIGGGEFKLLLEGSPKASLWVARQLGLQIRALTERIFEFSALNVSNRIRSELLRRAYEAGVKENQARISRIPTHQALAELLITHREAVTREFGALEECGVIARAGREVMIRDVARLSEMLQRASGESVGVGPAQKRAKGRRRN